MSRPFFTTRETYTGSMEAGMSIRATVPLELENGAVMSREEFDRLYSECEALERVELIEGGVREYLVWRSVAGEINWFQLRDGVDARGEPDNEGVIESEEFPGLRLDVRAMLAGDRPGVVAAVRRDATKD
jgi:hypothetical protein